jgi:hypothetical protein
VRRRGLGQVEREPVLVRASHLRLRLGTGFSGGGDSGAHGDERRPARRAREGPARRAARAEDRPVRSCVCPFAFGRRQSCEFEFELVGAERGLEEVVGQLR